MSSQKLLWSKNWFEMLVLKLSGIQISYVLRFVKLSKRAMKQQINLKQRGYITKNKMLLLRKRGQKLSIRSMSRL